MIRNAFSTFYLMSCHSTEWGSVTTFIKSLWRNWEIVHGFVFQRMKDHKPKGLIGHFISWWGFTLQSWTSGCKRFTIVCPSKIILTKCLLSCTNENFCQAAPVWGCGCLHRTHWNVLKKAVSAFISHQSVKAMFICSNTSQRGLLMTSTLNW